MGDAVEQLGTVSCPSGDLFLFDVGLIELWSGDGPPLLVAGDAPPETVSAANAAVDLEIHGPDAVVVASLIDLAVVRGRYAFDVPADSGLIADRVAATGREKGLQASVRPMARMPHLERLHRLLDDAPGGAEVPFHGPWGLAVRGAPRDRALPVLGVRMDPDGPDAGRWRSVWVEFASSDEPLTVEPAGYVAVDEARLMFADPVALGAWQHEPVDGLVDLVFWGRDAETVAADLGADRLPSDRWAEFGWLDRTIDDLEPHGRALVARHDDPALKFAFNLRAHDDQHRWLSVARGAPTGSATIELAGTPVTGFFTSWGDGAFPVFRDVRPDGTVARVRVELGAPEIEARQRRFDELWSGEFARAAIVSARVTADGRPVAWLYREGAEEEHDSGWRIFAGDESPEYLADPEHAGVVPLREVIAADPALEALLRTPAPVAFERGPDGSFVTVDLPVTG